MGASAFSICSVNKNRLAIAPRTNAFFKFALLNIFLSFGLPPVSPGSSAGGPGSVTSVSAAASSRSLASSAPPNI